MSGAFEFALEAIYCITAAGSELREGLGFRDYAEMRPNPKITGQEPKTNGVQRFDDGI